MSFVPLLIGLAFVLLITLATSKRRKNLAVVWQGVARQLGLTFNWSENSAWNTKWSISGVLRGVPVRAQYSRQTENIGDTTQVREEALFYAGTSGRIPVRLTVQADSVLRSLGRLVQGRDEKIGDPQFDAAVELPAMDAHVCAALSAPARKHLRTLIDAGGAVREGMVVLAQAANKSENAEWLAQMLQFLAQLAELLSVTPDVLCERLAQNAMTDPCPGVRLRNLGFLIDPETRATLPALMSTARALLADTDAPVRLLAAKQLGEDGHPVLRAIALDAYEPTAVRVDALRGLALARASQLQQLLPQLLGANPPELVCAALSIIASRRLNTLAEAVAECADSEHEAVRAAVARVLVSVPAQHAEGVLIRLLTDSSSEVQLMSAESLGAMGSVAAVEPLLGVANAFGRAQVRQAARGAIGRIQSRLGDVEAGRLSLAEEDGLRGALSVAEGAAARAGGEVSVVEEATSTSDANQLGERQRFSWREEPAGRRTR